MNPEKFIEKYEKALGSQLWSNVSPLMLDQVCVTFSNGDVHEGKLKVQAAFEHNFTMIKNEQFEIQNIRWLLKNETTAVYLFDFQWSGIIGDKNVSGNGLGTSVLLCENGEWKLLAEHMGRKA